MHPFFFSLVFFYLLTVTYMTTTRIQIIVVLYHHCSSLIWHEEEGFPSNVELSKLKMTTSVTLGLGKNCPHKSDVKTFLLLFINHYPKYIR